MESGQRGHGTEISDGSGTLALEEEPDRPTSEIVHTAGEEQRRIRVVQIDDERSISMFVQEKLRDVATNVSISQAGLEIFAFETTGAAETAMAAGSLSDIDMVISDDDTGKDQPSGTEFILKMRALLNEQAAAVINNTRETLFILYTGGKTYENDNSFFRPIDWIETPIVLGDEITREQRKDTQLVRESITLEESLATEAFGAGKPLVVPKPASKERLTRLCSLALAEILARRSQQDS